MCDIVFTRGTRSGEPEFCPHPNAHFCSALQCQSALPYLSCAYLCELHTEVCMHCGQFYCSKCLAAHQPACAMKPTQPGIIELVERVLHDHMT